MTKDDIIKMAVEAGFSDTWLALNAGPSNCELPAAILARFANLVSAHEQNLSCKSTQARLAASWGYVKAQPEQVTHTVIAGALFDFMGYLTSRRKRIVLSAFDDAAPAANALEDFAKKRGLSLDDAQVREWIDALAPPKRQPCQTCESLARAVMMDQTGRDA